MWKSGSGDLMSDNVEEMSLIDIIRQAPGLEKQRNLPKPEVPEEKVDLLPPISNSEEKKEETVEEAKEVVESSEGIQEGFEIPELSTPEPDHSWDWERAQAHEDRILEKAFCILKDTLTEQGIEFEESTAKPYTVMVGDLTVQNIILPWEVDARVTVFKGIRIRRPEHLKKRVDAFRRKQKEGPFNFKGLIERIKLRSREILQASDEKQRKEKLKVRLETFQKRELASLSTPSGLSLSRNEDGTYNGSLAFYCLSLPAVKAIIKFGTKIEPK